MATLDVVSTDNKKAGTVELDPSVFEAVVKPSLLHAEVRRQLARRRAGTHSSKNRSAVSGGGAKPYRQKGTGRARQGSTRAPQYAGGGAVFAPVPRGYEHALNKKTRRAALRAALSQRLRDEAVKVVSELDLEEFKTRRLLELFEQMGLAARSLLVVIEGPKPKLEISARNLPGVSVVRAEGLNVYDVLRHEQVLLSQAALEAVQERLRKPAGGGAS